MTPRPRQPRLDQRAAGTSHRRPMYMGDPISLIALVPLKELPPTGVRRCEEGTVMSAIPPDVASSARAPVFVPPMRKGGPAANFGAHRATRAKNTALSATPLNCFMAFKGRSFSSSPRTTSSSGRNQP